LDIFGRRGEIGDGMIGRKIDCEEKMRKRKNGGGRGEYRSEEEEKSIV
jgi:hypothetical protein